MNEQFDEGIAFLSRVPFDEISLFALPSEPGSLDPQKRDGNKRAMLLGVFVVDDLAYFVGNAHLTTDRDQLDRQADAALQALESYAAKMPTRRRGARLFVGDLNSNALSGCR